MIPLNQSGLPLNQIVAPSDYAVIPSNQPEVPSYQPMIPSNQLGLPLDRAVDPTGLQNSATVAPAMGQQAVALQSEESQMVFPRRYSNELLPIAQPRPIHNQNWNEEQRYQGYGNEAMEFGYPNLNRSYTASPQFRTPSAGPMQLMRIHGVMQSNDMQVPRQLSSSPMPRHDRSSQQVRTPDPSTGGHDSNGYLSMDHQDLQQQYAAQQFPTHRFPQRQFPQHQFPQHQFPQHQFPQHQFPQHQFQQHHAHQGQLPRHDAHSIQQDYSAPAPLPFVTLAQVQNSTPGLVQTPEHPVDESLGESGRENQRDPLEGQELFEDKEKRPKKSQSPSYNLCDFAPGNKFGIAFILRNLEPPTSSAMEPTSREGQTHSESEGEIISLMEKKRKRAWESNRSKITENEVNGGSDSVDEEKNIDVKKPKKITSGLASVESSSPPPSTSKPRRVVKACVACSKGRRKCVDPKGPGGCKGCQSRGIQCQISTDLICAGSSAGTDVPGDDSQLPATDTTIEPPRDPLTNAKMYNHLKNVELKEYLVSKGFDGDMLPSGKRLTRHILLKELYKFDEKEGLPRYPHTSWTSLKPAASVSEDAKALDPETHFTMQSLPEPRHRNLVCTQCKVNITITKSCSRVPCDRCKDLGLECTYPKHVFQYGQTHLRVAKDIDFTRINDWDGVHGDGVSIGVDVRPENVVQPATNASHYLVITVARLSSGDNSAIMALLRKGPRVGLMWRGLLRVGNRGVRYSEPGAFVKSINIPIEFACSAARWEIVEQDHHQL
ncbi:hypothetical protein BGAL_0755g00030 [Botrytis galanthina]|uniref:Zn(2)-C6 fungal-type domain-containing protein n=1 Tax=Botrytis galanthina TaxID=278940 RepID=A0A4S8QH01_9HELO|nr:hypothetical protein BGAL_0755g00030 [Botrytis galanthina]